MIVIRPFVLRPTDATTIFSLFYSEGIFCGETPRCSGREWQEDFALRVRPTDVLEILVMGCAPGAMQRVGWGGGEGVRGGGMRWGECCVQGI